MTKAGSSELEEPIAIRPTSETIIYPLYSQVWLLQAHSFCIWMQDCVFAVNWLAVVHSKPFTLAHPAFNIIFAPVGANHPLTVTTKFCATILHALLRL